MDDNGGSPGISFNSPRHVIVTPAATAQTACHHSTVTSVLTKDLRSRAATDIIILARLEPTTFNFRVRRSSRSSIKFRLLHNFGYSVPEWTRSRRSSFQTAIMHVAVRAG